MTKLGNAIRKRLDDLGQTQGWLADELEVSKNAVSKWINTGQISLENALAAGRMLGLTVEELVGEVAPKVGPSSGETADAMLRLAAEMLDTYRLADPAERVRIDAAFEDVRSRIEAGNQVKMRAP